MLLLDSRKFVSVAFDNEDEIERVTIENAEYIFGPSSIYFPKKLIRTPDGTGTIPDGYVIDLESRIWYIVEAELAHHSVWSHIAPQVAKQIIASNTQETKQRLIEFVIDQVRDDELLQEKFADQKIEQIDYRRVLNEILQTDPIIGMPIDAIKNDLREWAATLCVDVRLWLIRKYAEFNNPENIAYEIPEEFRPAIISNRVENAERSNARYDVSIGDLVDADLLSRGQKLTMPYKPRNGEQKHYEATVLESGELEVMGRRFAAPSYAALFGIQDAGSSRSTVNGWQVWRVDSGETLADLREKLLETSGQPQSGG